MDMRASKQQALHHSSVASTGSNPKGRGPVDVPVVHCQSTDTLVKIESASPHNSTFYIMAAASDTCIAITCRNTQCTRRVVHESYCRIHARPAPAPAVEPVLEVEDTQERRRRLICEEIADAPYMPVARLLWFLQRLADVWVTTPAMRALHVPLAYYNCVYVTQRHVGYPALVQAVVGIVRQTRGYHPSGLSYVEVPVEERRAAVTALNEALVAYAPIQYLYARLHTSRSVCRELESMLATHMEFLEHQSTTAILHVHTPVLRPLAFADEERFCVLLQDTIPRDGLYTRCDICKNVLDATAAETALQSNRACPLCRTAWTATTVYQNTQIL